MRVNVRPRAALTSGQPHTDRAVALALDHTSDDNDDDSRAPNYATTVLRAW
jgi:hypothetical protein